MPVWLWVFGAAVTTLFNLDAAIVLLTPLYLRVTRRYGLDPVAVAFQPVLLASLASSALPVSVAVALAAVTRRLPFRALPIDAAIVAAGLAVLAAAAEPHLGLDSLLRGDGIGADLRAFGVAVIGANAINNLPALLVGLPNLRPATAWAYLAGVNIGPVLWISGSLAGLLWADIMRHHGHPVSPGQYARVGARVGLPALTAAAALVVLTGALAR